MPTNPPPPDDAAKASWPTQIHKQTWVYLLRRTIHEFGQDGGIDAAAGLTFFAVLSVFPAALAIVSLIGVIGDGPATVDRLLSLLNQVAPEAVTEVLRQPLDDMATASTASLTFVIGVLAALWSASAFVSAFGRAMNRIYEVDEGRPYWKRKPAQLAVTVLLVALVLLSATIVVVSGPILHAIGEALGIGNTAVSVWDVAKWPVLTAAVVVLVAVLYATTPNIQQPRFRWLSLGAIVAIVLLAAASAGFAYYVGNFSPYNQTFGTLAGVIIFLIWVFIVNMSLLLGAELNTELERGRELQAGIPAETQLQLPPRDTTSSDLRQRTAHIDEQHGTLLRRGQPLPARTDTLIARVRETVHSIWVRIRDHS
ncbi:YihY/virulence factor BrkB family protein [Paeniglutamicibacter antarcticus]|uniref:YihY/virulence factor BrkB family protein n=1 Tax=Arthrobacter terrae TaxID=2935737 RepID=A0A931CK89_9MICC|nr:YihY/virulence factor BrkB family protein [Arthrobacter terrae]MBG0738015.1 YihY/virulence factor BrkB family protein [Arthrobacter terrae]